MWLARIGGFLIGFGALLSVGALFGNSSAEKGAFMALLLASLLVAIASSVVRRRAKGPSRLETLLKWTGSTGFVLAILSYVIVMSRGVARPEDYAKQDLSQLEMAQATFMLDSGRTARSLEELGSRYEPTDAAKLHGEQPILRPTADGWMAEVRIARTAQTCVIYEGRTPVAPATEEGRAACTRQPAGVGLWIALLITGIGLALGALSVRRGTPAPAPAPA